MTRYSSPPRDSEGHVLAEPTKFPALVYVNPREIKPRDPMQHIWDMFAMYDPFTYRDGNKA